MRKLRQQCALRKGGEGVTVMLVSSSTTDLVLTLGRGGKGLDERQ